MSAAVPNPSGSFDDAKEEAGAGKAEGDGESDVRDKESSPPAASAPAPPPIAEPAPAADRAEPVGDLRKLHEQAAVAAASRRCLEVRTLGQKIRGLDTGYHDKVFVNDRRLTSCLSSGGRKRLKSK